MKGLILATLVLALVVIACEACTIGGAPPVQVATLSYCRLNPGLSYSHDQVMAIHGGCPMGIAPSGHPLTLNAPCVDPTTGLPSDDGCLAATLYDTVAATYEQPTKHERAVEQCGSPLTELEATQCNCWAGRGDTDADIAECFGEDY